MLHTICPPGWPHGVAASAAGHADRDEPRRGLDPHLQGPQGIFWSVLCMDRRRTFTVRRRACKGFSRRTCASEIVQSPGSSFANHRPHPHLIPDPDLAPGRCGWSAAPTPTAHASPPPPTAPSYLLAAQAAAPTPPLPPGGPWARQAPAVSRPRPRHPAPPLRQAPPPPPPEWSARGFPPRRPWPAARRPRRSALPSLAA